MRSWELVFSPTTFRSMVDVFVAKMQCGGQTFSISLKIDCFNGIFSTTAQKRKYIREKSQKRLFNKIYINTCTILARQPYVHTCVHAVCRPLCVKMYISCVLRIFSKKFCFQFQTTVLEKEAFQRKILEKRIFQTEILTQYNLTRAKENE